MTERSVTFRLIPGALLSAVLLSGASSPARAESRAISLDEAYAAALKRSETLAERGEIYAQVMAQIDEIWSEIRPHLTLNGTQVWQDTPGPGVSFPIPPSAFTGAVAVHQPVFSGLRDFLALKATKAQGESARLAVVRAKELLYQDVASAYLNLLQSRDAIATREAQAKLTEDRVKELKGFEEIGRSRRSEGLAARSQLAQTQADAETARGQERVQQALFQFLTGIDEELAPQAVSVPGPEDEKPFLDKARSRPDVEAARRDAEYADLYVSIERRQHLPTAALDGSYYLKRPNNFYKNVNWDLTLTASLPLYWGGQVDAQTREAQAASRSRAAALALAERQAALDVRSAYRDLTSQLSIVKALENALALAEANAKAQAADYRNGLVTNIDVLTSLTTMHDTRLRLDSARLAAFLARVRLEVASGGPGSAQ